MEYMPEFETLRPATIEDVLTLCSEHSDAKFIAGGTDLLVNIRRGIATPQTLIDLSRVSEMDSITETENGGIRIGAGVTLAEIADNGIVKTDYPAIAEAAVSVAAATHRQVATLGGNLCLDTRCVYYNQSEWWRGSNDYCLKYRGEICHVAPKGDHCFAAFSGDMAPAIIALGGAVQIIGPGGERSLPLEDMYTDDGAAHMLLEPGELVVSVTLSSGNDMKSGYEKVRVRGAIDFPIAGVAIALKREGETLSHLRVALTGTNSCPLLLSGTDDLIGKPLNEASIEALLKLLPKQIQPMTSTFSPPGYRRKVTANLMRALAKRVFEG